MSAMKSTSSFSGALNSSAASFQHLSSLASDSRNNGTEKAGGVGLDLFQTSDVVDLLYDAWDDGQVDHGSVNDGQIGEVKVPSLKMVKMAEAIVNFEKKWAKVDYAKDIRFRIVIPADVTGASNRDGAYLEFSLRELKPIKSSDNHAQQIIWEVQGYVDKILNLESQQNLCRVRLQLGELGQLSDGLVDSLILGGYQIDLHERKMAATTLQPKVLQMLCRRQTIRDYPKEHKKYYNHSESLAMLGVDTDCTRRLQDLESVVVDARSVSNRFFGTGDAEDVDFPAFPFLINHLRDGRSYAAIKWFLARQSYIAIQSLAESASLVNLTPAELAKELLTYANDLGNSEFSNNRQLGKDLSSFANANSRFVPASTIAPSLRSRL